MAQLFANNAFSSLGASLSAVATSLTLATGTGSRFPSPTGGDHFLLTLAGLDGNGNENAWEIVRVTARSTDTLTVVRAQEGTTAALWASGTRVELRATKGTFDGLLQLTGGTITGPVTVVNGAYTALKVGVTGLVSVGGEAGSADSRFTITNGGAVGLEFSQTAIAGENRILSYNRLATAFVPLSLAASSLRVNISGTDRFTIGTDGTATFAGALSTTWGVFTNTRFGADAAYVSRRARGTVGSPTASGSGDGQLMRFDYYDGAAYIPAAQISAFVDGTPGANDMPGRLSFSTTADGASSPTERMRITSGGDVLVGTTSVDATGVSTIYMDTATKSAIRLRNSTSGANGYVGAFSPNEWRVRTTTATDLTIGTNDVERMRIDASGDSTFMGDVGIGVAPAFGLDIERGGRIRVGLSASGFGQLVYGKSATATNNWHVGSEGDGSFRFYSGDVGSGTERMRIDSAGLSAFRNSTGFGYGVGSGSTAVQPTSKSTAVTINKPSGRITMHNAALAAGASVTFILDNNTISANDTVVVAGTWTAVDPINYTTEVVRLQSNGAVLRVTNISAGSLSEAVAINFSVIKGAMT